MAIEKSSCLPATLEESELPQAKALYELVEHIFDRNACLLPGYFVINEILKAYPENRHWPHWVSLFNTCLCQYFQVAIELVNGIFIHAFNACVLVHCSM